MHWTFKHMETTVTTLLLPSWNVLFGNFIVSSPFAHIPSSSQIENQMHCTFRTHGNPPSRWPHWYSQCAIFHFRISSLPPHLHTSPAHHGPKQHMHCAFKTHGNLPSRLPHCYCYSPQLLLHSSPFSLPSCHRTHCKKQRSCGGCAIGWKWRWRAELTTRERNVALPLRSIVALWDWEQNRCSRV